MKFLCLHGASTNAEIFEIQTGGLTSELTKQGHTFKYINGSIESKPQKEFEKILEGPFYNHYTRDTLTPGTTVSQALSYTRKIIAEEGPFDAVMGFSQGAALACTLLAEGKKAGRNEFKCAVFICAGLPFRADGMGQLAVEEMGGLVDVPTAHIVGRQDELYEDGMKLYKLCEGGKAVVYDHGSGHCVPFDPETTDRMVKVIEEVIGRV